MAQSDSFLMLRGTLDPAKLEDILLAVGLSRQTVEIVLGEAGIGQQRLLLKAGRVLVAKAPPDEGRAAFHRIYRAPGRAFAVWRRPNVVGTPIGSLAELLSESLDLAEPSEPVRTAILSGSFSDHRLEDVLDVLAMTRQLVELTVVRRDGSHGRLVIKADRLLACEDDRGLRSGREALQEIWDDPGQSFEVVGIATNHGLPAPIGELGELLTELRSRPGPASRASGTSPDILFEGAYRHIPLADVLASLSLSRVPVELVSRRNGVVVGAILLKAGHVVEVRALKENLSGHEAFFALMSDPGDSFTVFRRVRHDVPQPEGCQTIRELLLAAKRPGRPPAQLRAVGTPASGPPTPPAPRRETGTLRAQPPPLPQPVRSADSPRLPASESVAPNVEDVVLEGALADFSVEEVLSVAGLSRQVIRAEFFRGTQPHVGLTVKAGHILSASCGNKTDPNEVIACLLGAPGASGTRFRVCRIVGGATSESIGNLDACIAAVKAAGGPATPPPAKVPPSQRFTPASVHTIVRTPSPADAPSRLAEPADDNASSVGISEVAATHSVAVGMQVAAAAIQAAATAMHAIATAMQGTASAMQASAAPMQAIASALTTGEATSRSQSGRGLLWFVAFGQLLVLAAIAVALWMPR